MEASFCGPKAPANIDPSSSEAKKYNYHFTSNDLMEIGKKLCQTLLLYSTGEVNPDQ